MRATLIVLGLSLACPAAAAPPVPIAPNRDDRRLIEELDEVVAHAEKQARPLLREKVTTAEQALAAAPVRDDRRNYVVYEYRGWFIVAWQGGGDRPAFWFHYTAIRQGSKDMFGSGSW